MRKGMLNSRSNVGPSCRIASTIPSAARTAFRHAVPGELVAGAEDRQDAVPDVLVDKAVVVEHRLGGRREIAVQHVHDVIRQALLAEGREVPNIREEDREIEFLSLAGGSSLYFVEVEDNDVLCLLEETANDQIALDASLTREAREFIPAPSGCYLLFDLARRRDIGKSVQDLNTAGCAAAVAAALMEVWDPMADRDVKECLTPGDVFERGFVEVSDPWHDRFPGIPQIAASFSTIVPRTGFPGNREPLPQVFDGRPSMPKSCRAPRHVAFAVIATDTLFSQGRRIMELKAIASLYLLAILVLRPRPTRRGVRCRRGVMHETSPIIKEL